MQGTKAEGRVILTSGEFIFAQEIHNGLTCFASDSGEKVAKCKCAQCQEIKTSAKAGFIPWYMYEDNKTRISEAVIFGSAALAKLGA